MYIYIGIGIHMFIYIGKTEYPRCYMHTIQNCTIIELHAHNKISKNLFLTFEYRHQRARLLTSIHALPPPTSSSPTNETGEGSSAGTALVKAVGKEDGVVAEKKKSKDAEKKRSLKRL